jgi:hypothetical protein
VAALFGAHGFGGSVVRAGVKPAGESLAANETCRLARKVRENQLRHVLCQVRVAIQLPQRRRINEVEMPPHQFGEGIFGIGFRVAAQQFTIRCHFQPIAPGRAKTAQGI